ncbi:MAG: hypothetical protein IPO05_04190 [Flavobacteriales bacterium]|nr:hypothetical protein [Flavobacteriales bacterium]
MFSSLTRLRNLLPGLFLAGLLAPSATLAQPTTVDIDLVQGPTANQLDVRLRANGASFTEVISNLVFTVRWPSTSPATLSIGSSPWCASNQAFPLGPSAQVTNGSFKYRTYTSVGNAQIGWLIDDGGCEQSLPADTWVTVFRINVNNNTGCTPFNITNDAFTLADNRDFFISLNGQQVPNRTGTIDATGVNIGSCTVDCLGVVGGTALPGTPCNDGNACTVNDVYTGTAPSCGCAGTLVAAPVITNTSSNSPICAGATLSLTASATGSGTITYSWVGPNGFSSGAQNPSIIGATAAATGSYTVTASNGCSSSQANVSVTVNPNPATPTISAGGPLTFCAGGSVTLTSSSATGNVWSTGATTQAITVNTSGTYSVTVTNGNGCSATSAGTTVTVNPNPATPTISAGGPLTFCAGGSVTLTSSSATGNVWSTGATTQAITVSTSGTYSVTVTNGNGCSATSAGTTVTVNPNPATPTISAGGPLTFCAGGSVTLTSSSATGHVEHGRHDPSDHGEHLGHLQRDGDQWQWM